MSSKKTTSTSAETENSKVTATVLRKLSKNIQAYVSTAMSQPAIASASGATTAQTVHTLDVDKRMEMPTISGHEPVHTLIEWYDRVLTKVESTIPGARDILTTRMELKTNITFEMVNALQNKRVAQRLNSELYSWLYNVCTDKAWTYLKSAPQGNGLAAFRVVYLQVARRTPQQMEAEFGFLNNPEGPKATQEMSHWLFSRENRLTMLQIIDSRYAVTEPSRKNIAYKSMPEDMKRILDAEIAKGNLVDWRSFTDFLINYSDSDAATKNTKSVPIAAPVQDNKGPVEPEYSDEEWCHFLSQQEGQDFALSNPSHPKVQQYVLSIVAKCKGAKGFPKG